MTTDQEILAILQEHKGVRVGGEAGVLIVPLSMEDALDPQVAEDLAKIGQQLYASLELLAQADGKPEDIDALMAAALPVLPRVKRLLARCIDRPLGEIPLVLAPVVLRRFVTANFSGPRLKPWADLFRETMGSADAKPSAPSTSGTPASSSPITDTTSGGATPATSSSSGSGGACAGSAAASPTT